MENNTASVTAFTVEPTRWGMMRYDVRTARVEALSVPRATAFQVLVDEMGLTHNGVQELLRAAEENRGFTLSIK